MGSHDSATMVQPAVWQNDRQPHDVCHGVAALHFLVALWLDPHHVLSHPCPSLSFWLG